MPALKPVFATARISFRGTSLGQAIVNVFHVTWSGAQWDQASIVSLLTAVRTSYEQRFIPQLNGNYSGDSARAVDLTSAAGVEANQSLAGSPAAPSAFVPQQAACCVTWKIGRHYRGGHPRTYLGPLPGGALESPTSLAPAYITAVAGAANSFLTTVNALTIAGKTCKLVAVHRHQLLQELATPITSDITTATVDSRIDTMRRRLGKDR